MVRYCELTPCLDDGKVQFPSTFDELVSTIHHLDAVHRRYLAEHPPEPDEDPNVEVGYSFVVKNKDAEEAHVGVSDRGWILIRLRPGPTRRVKGDQVGSCPIAFLFPEWTEFFEHELLGQNAALNTLRLWLDGDLSAAKW